MKDMASKDMPYVPTSTFRRKPSPTEALKEMLDTPFGDYKYTVRTAHIH
jgi:hypothetical protein